MFAQRCAHVITHICFEKATLFSSTGHSSSRVGAIRNSSNSQKSTGITVMILLYSTFASSTGFQRKKNPEDFVCAEKPAGRHPHLICMPNYPTHELSCSPVHLDGRDVCASPCDSSVWAWGWGEHGLAGTEPGLDFCGGWTLSRLTWWAKPAGTSIRWAQADHQPAFGSPWSMRHPDPFIFFRRCYGVLAQIHPQVKTCGLTHP